MARQKKTAKPKQKFTKPCLDCGQDTRRSLIDGILFIVCGCGTRRAS